MCIMIHDNAQPLSVIAHLNTKHNHIIDRPVNILATSLKKIIVGIKLVTTDNAQRLCVIPSVVHNDCAL